MDMRNSARFIVLNDCRNYTVKSHATKKPSAISVLSRTCITDQGMI